MPAWAAQWCTGTPGGRLEFWQNEPYLSGSGRGWTTDALICGAHRVSGELLPVGIDWRTAKWKRPEMTPGCNASDCAPVVDAPARDNRAWVAQRQWDLTMNIVCHLAQSTDERQHAELLAATLAALEAGGVVL